MTPAWDSIAVAGHPLEAFSPAGARTDAVLLILPNVGERASSSSALTDALSEQCVAAVAPVDSDCWWLDCIEPSFDSAVPPLTFLTDHVVPLIAEQFGASPPNVKLLGWGSGGQGVLQLAYRRPREFPALAAIDPAIDFHELHGRGTSLDELFPTREAARQATAILRMQGVGWPRRQRIAADPGGFWFEGAERLEMKLRSMGIPLVTEFTQSAGGDGQRFLEMQVRQAVEFVLTERQNLPVIPPGT